MRKTTLCVMALTASLSLLAGCSSDDGGGGGGGGSLPTIPTVHFFADGGNATTGAATNGGNAGTVSSSADGDILYDDGRTRPTVGTNVLAALLANNPITYTDLIGALAPVVAAGTATLYASGWHRL